MNRQTIAEKFSDHHQALIDYIRTLTDEEFMYSPAGKWTPGQQLEHVLLCVRPLSQALGNKSFVAAKFGTLERPGRDYDDVIQWYQQALQEGGKAPSMYVPEAVQLSGRDEIGTELASEVHTLRQNLEDYSEQELDSLVLPHPLLGKLSIREMLYLMTYHATHHQEKTKESLVK